MEVSGDALLDGILTVEIWPGYTPRPDFEYYDGLGALALAPFGAGDHADTREEAA